MLNKISKIGTQNDYKNYFSILIVDFFIILKQSLQIKFSEIESKLKTIEDIKENGIFEQFESFIKQFHLMKSEHNFCTGIQEPSKIFSITKVKTNLYKDENQKEMNKVNTFRVYDRDIYAEDLLLGPLIKRTITQYLNNWVDLLSENNEIQTVVKSESKDTKI